MSEKWTKGSWFIHPHGPRYTVNQQGTNRHVAMVSCYKQVEGDDDENIANAHLIAAAPDLYDALRVIEHALPDSPYKEIVRAALKKARGES